MFEQQHGKGVQAVDGHTTNNIILLDAKSEIYTRRFQAVKLNAKKACKGKFACKFMYQTITVCMHNN